MPNTCKWQLTDTEYGDTLLEWSAYDTLFGMTVVTGPRFV
jgi:hypothetical protein